MNFHQRRDRAHAQKMAKTRNKKTNNILRHLYASIVRDLMNPKARLWTERPTP